MTQEPPLFVAHNALEPASLVAPTHNGCPPDVNSAGPYTATGVHMEEVFHVEDGSRLRNTLRYRSRTSWR